MSRKLTNIRPSDLPTKRVTAPDGTVIQMKVVRADSSTFGLDIQAAFRSNVRRIRDERRVRERAAQNTTEA